MKEIGALFAENACLRTPKIPRNECQFGRLCCRRAVGLEIFVHFPQILPAFSRGCLNWFCPGLGVGRLRRKDCLNLGVVNFGGVAQIARVALGTVFDFEPDYAYETMKNYSAILLKRWQ